VNSNGWFKFVKEFDGSTDKVKGPYPKPWAVTDTFFTEWMMHEKYDKAAQMVSASTKTQSGHIYPLSAPYEFLYPPWIPKWKPGDKGTMSVFHQLGILKEKWVYNVVDDEAQKNQGEILKTIRSEWLEYISKPGAKAPIIKRQQQLIDMFVGKLDDAVAQMKADGSKSRSEIRDAENDSRRFKRQAHTHFETCKEILHGMKPEDWDYLLHPWPHASIGWLHLHTVPHPRSPIRVNGTMWQPEKALNFLRQYSAKSHDHKNLYLEAVFEAEKWPKLEGPQAIVANSTGHRDPVVLTPKLQTLGR
jgi:hypothetical protein